MEPETCTKMLRNLSEKLRAKFAGTSLGYSLVKIVRLDDALLEFFKLEASPVEDKSLQQKDKKRRKRKSEKNEKNKTKPQRRRSLSQNFDFCACLSKNVVKRDCRWKGRHTAMLHMPF